jgi:hypothetical protein
MIMIRKIYILSLAVIMTCLIFVSPAQAAEIPQELDAAIVTTTELTPGDTGVIQISVQNNNVVEKVTTSAIQSGLSAYFGAAVSLTATLETGTAPIAITNGKALLGTLQAGMSSPAIPFEIEVNEDAAPGDYSVRLQLDYRILETTSADGTEKVDAEWANRTNNQDLKITIKSKDPPADEQQLDFSITRMDAQKFAAEDTGIIQVCVQNNKTVEKMESSAMQANLSQNYGAAVSLVAHAKTIDAPISIKTEDLLLGTLPAGQATPALPISIEINKDAKPGIYKVNLSLTYKTLKTTSFKDGDAQLEWSAGTASQDIDIEIEKNEDLEFVVTATQADLNPGSRQEIQVTFQNIGSDKARDATAKLSAASPISMTDNVAFLGDLEPGASATGTFGLKVASDALAKQYTLDAQIQYTDTKGNKVTSDVFKVPLPVQPTKSLLDIAKGNWISATAGAGAIVIIWGIVAVISTTRKKSRGF